MPWDLIKLNDGQPFARTLENTDELTYVSVLDVKDLAFPASHMEHGRSGTATTPSDGSTRPSLSVSIILVR